MLVDLHAGPPDDPKKIFGHILYPVFHSTWRIGSKTLKFQVTFLPLLPTKLWVKHAILAPINSKMIDYENVSFEKNFFGGPESENLASSRDLIQKIDSLTYQALKSELRGPWECHGS